MKLDPSGRIAGSISLMSYPVYPPGNCCAMRSAAFVSV
jgi:hypothetical protein